MAVSPGNGHYYSGGPPLHGRNRDKAGLEEQGDLVKVTVTH